MRLILTSLALLLCLSGYSQPNGKNVLMEYITSVGCPGCAWGNYVRDSVLQNQPNVLFVAIHRNDPNHLDAMGCPDADSVLSEYLWAHPTAMVDRILWNDFPQVCVTTNQWDTKINLRKMDGMAISVGGTTVYDSTTRSLDITVNGVIQWDQSRDIRVNAYIVEDSVQGNGPGYDQLNGNNNSPTSPLFGLGDPIPNYTHRYVLRDMLAGHHGLGGVIPNPVTAGTPFSHTFSTTLDTAWNAKRVYVVAVVQRHDPDPNNREIYNAARLDLNSTVLASAEESLQIPSEILLFPNPVWGGEATLQMAEKDDYNILVTDLTGRVLKRFDIQGNRMTVPTAGLTAGSYLLRVTGKDKAPKVIQFFVP